MKFIVLTKKHIIAAAAALVVTVTAVAASVGVFAKTDRKLPIYCVQSTSKQVALSFDAAWGNDDTEKLIEILGRYNAKATFFVVGGWVDKYPQSVKQLSDAGFSVQNHSNTHPYLTKCSTEQIVEELRKCNEKIASVTGKTPKLHRCPYGDYDNKVINAVESIDMYPIQWDVDSKDWMENATVSSIIKNVMSKVTDGSIILFHNDAKHTPEALPSILEQLVAKGYTFVFIEDMIYKENYRIDHTGKQIPVTENGSSDRMTSGRSASGGSASVGTVSGGSQSSSISSSGSSVDEPKARNSETVSSKSGNSKVSEPKTGNSKVGDSKVVGSKTDMAASGTSDAADAVITDTEGSKKDIGTSIGGVDSAGKSSLGSVEGIGGPSGNSDAKFGMRARSRIGKYSGMIPELM